nr:hypothetical protein [Tanacetum cinerariifolium]
MTTPSNNIILHNDIMADDSIERPPMLASGPYILTKLVTEAVPATEDQPGHLHKLAIGRLQQGESINKQDVKTSCFGSLVSSLPGIENQLSHTTQVVVAAQHYPEKYSLDTYCQAPKPHKTHTSSSRHTTSTGSHAATRNKSKYIAKLITPPSEPLSEEDSDLEQAQSDKDMQKSIALISKYIKNIYKPTNNNLRTSLNTRNKTMDTSLISRNDKQTWQIENQRTMIVAGARETISNQEEKGVSVRVKQGDWLDDTDEEPDE